MCSEMRYELLVNLLCFSSNTGASVIYRHFLITANRDLYSCAVFMRALN